MAWGDASIRAAATRGGLERIHSADYEFFSVVLYSRYTTVVYGD